MPKQRTAATQRARATQRAAGGRYTAHLRAAADICGHTLDPWGDENSPKCQRPPHAVPGYGCSEDPDFDEAAWRAELASKDAARRKAEESRWHALTPEERAAEIEQHDLWQQEQDALDGADPDAHNDDGFDPDDEDLYDDRG